MDAPQLTVVRETQESVFRDTAYISIYYKDICISKDELVPACLHTDEDILDFIKCKWDGKFMNNPWYDYEKGTLLLHLFQHIACKLDFLCLFYYMTYTWIDINNIHFRIRMTYNQYIVVMLVRIFFVG